MNNGNAQRASEKQFDELRICVERSFNKLRGRMDANVAQGWIGNSNALDRLLMWMIPGSTDFFCPISGKLHVAEQEKTFLADKFFKMNVTSNEGVAIVIIGVNFAKYFTGKTVFPRFGYDVVIRMINKSCDDQDILLELPPKCFVDLSFIHQLLESQPRGQDGYLLTNGFANIFYCEDVTQEIRAVIVHWVGGGWLIDAFPITKTSGAVVGSKVFYRRD